MKELEGGTSHNAALGGKSWLNSHVALFFGGMFVTVAFLNVLDLWTSTVALNRGLVEGNQLITGLAGELGLQVTGGLLIMKVMAIVGGLAGAVVGIRTRYRQVRVLAVAVMIFLAVVLIAVSVNNVFAIVNS